MEYICSVKPTAPMLVVSEEDFISNGNILSFEEAKQKQQHVAYDSITDRRNTMVIFISHENTRSQKADNMKYSVLVQGLETIKRHVKSARKTYVWIDHSCIRPETMQEAIESWPGYIERSDVMVSPVLSNSSYSSKVRRKSKKPKVSGILELLTNEMEPHCAEMVKASLHANGFLTKTWALCEHFVCQYAPSHNRLDQHFDFFNRLGSHSTDRPHILFLSDSSDADLPVILPRIPVNKYEEITPSDDASITPSQRESVQSVLEFVRSKLAFETWRYQGPVDPSGSPHGSGGRMVYEHSGVYSGSWDHGKRDGRGLYLAPNGDKYDGEWKEDKMHGFGRLTTAWGTVYTGNFQHGFRHGSGNYLFSTGEKFDGEWVNGIPCEGEYTLRNGVKTEPGAEVRKSISKRMRGSIASKHFENSIAQLGNRKSQACAKCCQM